MMYGSLFTGIGGFDVGLDRAGMECAFQVEREPTCNKILETHWPDVPRFTDVKDFHATSIPVRPELICGGFPCQDLSVAGRRAGLAGKRSGLFFEFMRIVSEFAPRWVLIENVPGLLSSNEGRDLLTIVDTLGEMGYGWAYRILDAQWFGVAQRRRRVFIVGCAGDVRSAAGVLFEPESLPWDFAPSRETGARVAATLTRGADSSGKGGYAGRRQEDDVNIVHCEETSKCLTRGPGSGVRHDGTVESYVVSVSGKDVSHALTADGHDASEDGTGRGTPLVVTAIQERAVSENPDAGPQGKGFQDDIAFTMEARTTPQAVAYQEHGSNVGPMGTLRTGNGQAAVPFMAVAFGQNERGELREIDVPTALTTGGGKPGQGYTAIRQGSAVRRLTPTECERLQGFPDGHTLGLSNSARYKALGNAVAVPVAEWIGKRIVSTPQRGKR